MAPSLRHFHSYHWSHRPFYFTINASLLDWSIFSWAWAAVNMFLWLWVGDLQGFSRGLWICHCGGRFSHFEMLLIPSGCLMQCFKITHIWIFKKERKMGNISRAQPATSWIMALLTASYFLALGNVPSRAPAANSRTTSSSRQKGQNTEFANTFSLVTALPMMKWMDCFQEELPQETRKHDSCRCGGKLDGKLAINWTELMLIWARDTEAQGYNWFLCYHSWDSLPFPRLLWAPVVSGAPVGNPEIAWRSPSIPPPPMLTPPNSEVPLTSFQKCPRAAVRTQTTVAAVSCFLTIPK